MRESFTLLFWFKDVFNLIIGYNIIKDGIIGLEGAEIYVGGRKYQRSKYIRIII